MIDIDKLRESVLSIFQQNLHSTYLYGSAANKQNDKNADINILILLKKSNYSQIENSAKFFKKWKRKIKTTPLIFDVEYLKASLDIFPIEFNDIKYNHKLIVGKNIFEEIKIDNKNLRLQCEQEIKGNLIHLESVYMLNYKKYKKLKKAMLEGLSSYAAVFRNILRLIEQDVKNRETNIKTAANILDFNPDPFLKLYGEKKGEIKLKKKGTYELYKSFFKEATKLANSIDKIKVE
ncbi:MAG: hypothetical protein FXF47_05870 [Candidatus Mcinerneyibacterium aminivorans]|uniref:Polymerase nucleotidyl transferase domain-containing protein n=1 Tax=Candidatus Mcinerneyibacterium aminivorans TaxID=2703815 RepID=A0A5D0MF92_9BACT|nr:MAG: hypothetical protein FXF47_05870 [Candidatus Mcinerneyibacterium aminivorans]